METRCRFAYLYFRLLEFVSDLPISGCTADVDLWEEDATMLHFLAHRATVPYPEFTAKRQGKLVNFSVARRDRQKVVA